MFKLGIPTPARDIQSQADLDAAAGIGLPAVLKTRTLGYDGGQKLLRKPADVAGAFAELGSVPCIWKVSCRSPAKSR